MERRKNIFLKIDCTGSKIYELVKIPRRPKTEIFPSGRPGANSR
jgi:hypothetical protein